MKKIAIATLLIIVGIVFIFSQTWYVKVAGLACIVAAVGQFFQKAQPKKPKPVDIEEN